MRPGLRKVLSRVIMRRLSDGEPDGLKTAVRMLIFVAALLPAGYAAAQPQAAPPGVVVSPAQVKSFPLSAEALGNARAYESVDVRRKSPLRSQPFIHRGRAQRKAPYWWNLNAEQLAPGCACWWNRPASSIVRRNCSWFASQLEQLKAKQEADAAGECEQSRGQPSSAPFCGRVWR
jgi:hypothetical protein